MNDPALPRRTGVRAVPVALVLFVAAGVAAVEAQAPPGLTISPRAGPPGTPVTLEMDGLPGSTEVVVGFGALREGYEWIEEAETGQGGVLLLTLEIPRGARVGRSHYFFVAIPGQPPLGTSGAFHVTGADGILRVTGRILEEGDASVRAEGPEGELYCLVGELGEPSPGDEVEVEGTLADPATCPDGIPIRVHTIR